jgi:hypothetical protein
VQATIQRSVPQPVAAPEALVGFDVEAVRVPSERSFASRVAQHPQFAMLASRLIPGDPKEIRRRLMAQSLRLSDSMAPDAYRAARSAQRVLGVAGEIEIFQRSGAENAAIHLVDTPILLEVQGPILSLLDEATLLGVFGHELGHYLAHGPRSPLRAPLSLTSVLGRAELDRPLEESLSRLSMAAELTADRIGLLVCQDLHTMLRLEMVTLTGLSSGALTWDTEAYLAQSRDLMEAELAQGGGFFGRTHPEHNLRSYALWLFSQTTTFRRLTGRGPGTRELAEVDGILARFFGDAEAPASSDLVLDYSRLGEPPRELHECALAAAVIVAHADEEVREDEVSAIERIFAPLVPDWRQYLDFEVALERFHELAPVLAAAGPDLVRSLFQLLVHVMGADDEVDAREVQVILTIGRAMGAETRFRQWLASTLAALKVPLRLDEAAPRDLPLPARRDEVADAFETYLRSVSRRGESETTLRRLLRLVGSGLPATTVAPPPGLERLDQRRLRELIEVSIDLQPFSALWGASSPFRSPQGSAPRRSFASLDGRGVREVAQQLEACLSAASEYEAVAASSPVDPEHVEGARGALAHAIHARAARTEPSDHEVFRSLLPAAAEAPERLASTDAVRAAWESSSAAITKLREPIQLEASGEMVAALSVLRRWSRTWVRFFVIGWWLARFALRRELARAWPDRAGEELTPAFLDDLADRIAASRGWRALAAAFDGLAVRHLLPSSSDALEPTVRRLVRIGPAVRDLAQTRSELRRAAAWPSDFVTPDGDLNRWEQALDARVRLLDVRDALARAAVPVQQAFPWVGVLPSASTLAALLAAWTQAGPRVVEMDALLGRASELLPTAPVLLDALAAAHPSSDAAAWRSATTSAWATAWLVRLERESGLASLGTAADDREVDRAATRLAELEEELREFEIERTLHQVDDAELLRTAVAEKHQRRTPAQKIREELLKETRKKRRLMPLRSFVRRFAPSGLLGVLPVWLLSPETMAILFPRQPLVDLVVFDEASQCTVEAGLPVLLRAKRVVIAGDEKQMPPSSYFALGTGDGDDASPEDESRREIQDILGSESLLTLARTRCAHAGLAWHYRCRHEALIAFSNHALYGGGLLTIPATASRDSRSPLRWVSVADGTYDAGENKREAERVVDVVHELLQRSPRPSIGVITFNLRQRKAVLDAIETRCARDDDFLGRWSEASTHESMDERPFVKNLEQVQGDERDVIVFSLGHAPQERRKKGSGSLERYVPARFGPLGQRGGERRLNVAISRAKSECTVVASFEPQHLTVATSKNEGPKLFKQFLEFAHHMHHGRRLEASRILDLVRDSARARTEQRVRLPIDGYLPLASQLSLALEEARIPHEVDVGASTFRVPVAVLDPRDPARYALAILLDDGTSTSSAFDQHVHRRAVLGTRGWKVISITAASWYRRPASILAEIEAAVPGARGALDSSLYAEHRSGRRRVSAEPPPPPSSPTTKPEAPAAAEAVPPWAAVIEDRLFQRALLHLHRHGSLGEAELTNLVGGPRRARQFARELEGLRERLPFRVEAQDLNGSKVYRVAGAT